MKDKLGVDIWYCDPHSPWQRGMIENTNGILRRDMPRKSDISDYTDKDIETIVSVRCPPPNVRVFVALVSTMGSGHLGALYGGRAEEAALAG